MPTEFLGVSGLTDEANMTLGDSALSRTGNGVPTARGLAGMSDPSAVPTLARMNSTGGGGTAADGGVVRRIRPWEAPE